MLHFLFLTAYALTSMCCLRLQARIVEPSSTTRHTPEAAVIAARSSGSAKLPTVCTPAIDDDAMCNCGSLWQHATVAPATRAGVQSYCFSYNYRAACDSQQASLCLQRSPAV